MVELRISNVSLAEVACVSHGEATAISGYRGFVMATSRSFELLSIRFKKPATADLGRPGLGFEQVSEVVIRIMIGSFEIP
ncbi:MAG: hypothetical protein IPJ98_24325 [Bryobacterales bacterium]|nr:hypothetical protein [Bryobacterales bacterium]